MMNGADEPVEGDEPAAAAIFLDTNILVYANVATAPLYSAAQQVIQSYAYAGADVWISRQILREYLATLTRP